MRIPLDEDDAQGQIADLDAREAAELAASGLVHVDPTADGRWRLRPRRRVGAVAVGRTEVVVAPKTGVRRLLFLLGYTADPGFRPGDVDGEIDDDLWPVVAETLSRHVEAATRRGVLRGYRTREDALPMVRGRIRVADQIGRRHGLPLPLELSFDEHSSDIAENRILRSAVRLMLAVPRLPRDTRNRLTRLDALLDGVEVLTPGSAVPASTSTRLNQHYRPALTLAEIVLRFQSLEIQPGGMRVSAFVVDMARVFEDFVGIALRESWRRRPGRTELQYRSWLDEAQGVLIKPDVVHVLDGRPIAVLDAKYKLESPSGGYSNADHYQMLAYCTALELPLGRLVYAAGTRAPIGHRVRNSSIEIVDWPLDLRATPSGLLEQIRILADAAWPSTSRSGSVPA